MNRYKINQTVTATVERVYPFGVFARLEDGTQGYIRRRELDLDADVEPTQVVGIGDTLTAVVIGLAEAGRRIELSRRAALFDPWREFAQCLHEGDVVRGSVQALHPRGVFVRITAGVNAFIPLAELATWTVQKPEELLWVGDEVEAIITRIVLSRKQIRLSIRARLEQYAKAVMLLERMESRAPAEAKDTLGRFAQSEERDDGIDVTTRDHVGHILIVDDHIEMRTSLADWLLRRGFNVAQAESFSDAMIQMYQEDCRVLLIDLNLIGSDGLEVIHHARRNGSRAYVCIMSSPDSLAERAEEIEDARVTQVFPKPLDLDEIERFLLSVARSEPIPRWRATSSRSTNTSPAFREIAAFEHAKGAALSRLQSALISVTQTLHAQAGIIFAIDPTSQAISILKQAGAVTLNTEALYGLDDSPVNDVIRESTPVFEGRVSEQARARFSKLLALLSFESCIGVPIQTLNEVRHAAFFFHREPNAFSSFRLRDAQAGALLFAALLETDSIDRHIQLLNPLLLSGQLAAGFEHELSSKVSGLELQLLNLIDDQRKQPDKPLGLSTVFASVLDLKNIVEAFQQLLRTNEGPAELDVNELVQRAELLVHPLAGKYGSKVIMKLQRNLPPVAGKSLAVQQVFINLILNALQQMALQAEIFKWKGRRILEIGTSFDETSHSIQVRFADTGPGIHRRLWNKIFTPGFSTRGGNGLGLFIARSFIQSLGGTIQVEESFIPLGTTFLVELPVIEKSK